MIFDPYSDRKSRDIRNRLSSALVEELRGPATNALSTAVGECKRMADAPVYRSYIEDRSALFQHALQQIRRDGLTDPRHQAVCLWNLGLFFEMHELLETIWQKSREPERTGLKGWIQAAGAYVHAGRGKMEAAQGLAKRAVMHLSDGRSALCFISNLDQLMLALADPTGGAPQLEAI